MTRDRLVKELAYADGITRNNDKEFKTIDGETTIVVEDFNLKVESKSMRTSIYFNDIEMVDQWYTPRYIKVVFNLKGNQFIEVMTGL